MKWFAGNQKCKEISVRHWAIRSFSNEKSTHDAHSANPFRLSLTLPVPVSFLPTHPSRHPPHASPSSSFLHLQVSSCASTSGKNLFYAPNRGTLSQTILCFSYDHHLNFHMALQSIIRIFYLSRHFRSPFFSSTFVFSMQ